MYRSLGAAEANPTFSNLQGDVVDARRFVIEVSLFLKKHSRKYKQYLRDHSLPALFSTKGADLPVARVQYEKCVLSNGRKADNLLLERSLKQTEDSLDLSAVRIDQVKEGVYFKKVSAVYVRHEPTHYKLLRKQQPLFPSIQTYSPQEASQRFKYPKSKAAILSQADPQRTGKVDKNTIQQGGKMKENRPIKAPTGKHRRRESTEQCCPASPINCPDIFPLESLQIDQSFFEGHRKFEANMENIRRRFRNHRI